MLESDLVVYILNYPILNCFFKGFCLVLKTTRLILEEIQEQKESYTESELQNERRIVM